MFSSVTRALCRRSGVTGVRVTRGRNRGFGNIRCSDRLALLSVAPLGRYPANLHLIVDDVCYTRTMHAIPVCNHETTFCCCLFCSPTTNTLGRKTAHATGQTARPSQLLQTSSWRESTTAGHACFGSVESTKLHNSTPTLQRRVSPAGWAEANSPCEGGGRSGGFGGTVLALPGLYRGRGCSGRLERRERGAKGAVLRPMIAIVHSGRHHFYS